ncbi:MAG: SBBP repeat-containing protein [Planctomycetes bacterium]|nr:SBBP repeat-containing protein [Planctomycetota bacterium]
MRSITKPSFRWLVSISIAVACPFLTAAAQQIPAAKDAATPEIANISTSAGSAFRRNKGQWPSSVQYASRKDRMDAFFTENGFTLSLIDERDSDWKPPILPLSGNHIRSQGSLQNSNFLPREIHNRATGQNLMFRWKGSPGSTWSATNELPGRESYFFGKSENEWVVDVPRYKSIQYKNARPGVDLRFYLSTTGYFEYDVNVAPGTDPESLSFQCDGAESLAIASDGSLEIKTKRGVLRQLKPRAYQLDSSGTQMPIECKYNITDGLNISFAVVGRDEARSLTIDPVLIYATYLGGSVNENLYAVATDDVGATYVSGSTPSLDFPSTPGAFQTTNNGIYLAGYVTKFSANGTLLYSTFINASEGYALAVDAAHNVFFAGIGVQGAFPTTPGSYNPNGVNVGYPGAAAIAKINPAGNGLVYSTYIGGNSVAYGVAVDSAGQAYLCGGAGHCCGAPPYPTTPHVFKSTGGLFDADAVVTKLNATGSKLLYSTLVGEPANINSGDTFAMGIAIDMSGNAYICGQTSSSYFPTTSGSFQTTYGGGYTNGFVTKLNATAAALIYSTYFGGNIQSLGNGYENAKGIRVDANGYAYVAGHANSINFPVTTGAFNTGPPISDKGFLAKFDPTGSSLVYSTFLGSSGPSGVGKFYLQPDGSVDVPGATSGYDLPTTPGAFQTSFQGGLSDGFYARINPLGNGLLYSTYIGGPGDTGEQPSGLAFSQDGVVHIAGITNSIAFPVTPNGFQKIMNKGNNTSSGTQYYDGFVALLAPEITGQGLSNYGAGTPGCSGPQLLQATYPKVGNALFSMSNTGAPLDSLGLLLVADQQDPVGSDFFGVGIQLLLDLPASTELYTFDIVSNDLGGNAALTPIPNNPTLANRTFFAQAIWAWLSGPQCNNNWNPPYGLSSSNGIVITIQP